MKKRTTRTPKTKPTKVKKVVRLSSKGVKGKSAKAIKKAKSTPLPSLLENFIKNSTKNRNTRKKLREKAIFFSERSSGTTKKEVQRTLSLLKTDTIYNPQFVFKSYHPYGNKKARKIWVNTLTGKKGHWREWNGEFYRTPKGKIKRWKNPLTGVLENKKKYTPKMEKDYLKVAREMQIRILQKNEGLNRQDSVVKYTKLASKGRSYVFEQIGSRR